METQEYDPHFKIKAVLACLVVILVFAGARWIGMYIDVKRSEPDYIITAKELHKEYKKELKADLKYKNKILLISGDVNGTNNSFDTPTVILNAGSLFGSIQCNFNKNSRPIANLETGDSVKIKGKCTGKTLTDVFIKNCVLVQ